MKRNAWETMTQTVGMMAALLLLLGGAGATSAFGQTCTNSIDDAWIGGSSGDWSGASNWSAGEPSSTCDVFIQSGAAVILDVNGSTSNLTIGSGNSLTLPNVTNASPNLNVGGSSIANSGEIIMSAPVQFGTTGLSLSSSGTVTLSGGGTITLDANSFGGDYIGGNGTLLNQSTIQGAGSFDMAFDNSSTGVIDANEPGGYQLVVGRNQAGPSTNTGLIEATNGGLLAMGSLTLNNVGGTIKASGTGSYVQLEGEGQGGETFTGGTWTSLSGGAIQVVDTSATLDGTNGNTITNSGTMQLVDGAPHPGGNFQGTINNTGSIQLLSKGSGIGINIPGGQTLTLMGRGNVTMGDGTNNSYNNQDYISGGTLVNQQLIQGTGGILNLTAFTNSSGATINDNIPVGSANLQLQLGRAGASTNAGTIEASNGGGIIIGSTTITNTGGTMEATGTGSYVDLSGSLGTSGLIINGGGTYTTSSGGTIYLGGGTLLDGTTTAITNSGLMLIDNYRSNAQIQGTFNNSGTLQMTSTGSEVSLCVPGSQTLTLNGAGTLIMGDGTSNVNNNQILLGCALGGGGTLVNEQTIQGAGSIGGISSVTNMGTINANDPVGVNNVVLYLSAQSTPVTNANVIEATNGGALQINVPVTNTNGKIQAVGAGSYVQLYSSNAILTGGTLTTSTGGTIYADGGATLSTVTNTGNMVIQDNNNAIFSGTITNTGTITVASTGDNTALAVPSGQTTTFTGSGSVTLTLNTNAGNNSTIAATQCGSATLVNSSPHTIQGSGTFFPNTNCFSVLTNSGTINANNSSGGPLIIEAANLTNTGTLEATNGAGLQFNYANVTNTSHTITATGTNSYVQLYSMTLTGGTLATSNGAAAYAERNSTLTGITNTGALTIPDNNNVTFSGTVTNNGTINLTSTGDGTVFVIPAGTTTTLAGTGTLTLTSTSNENAIIASSSCSSATLINESTIQGSGQVYPNTNCYGVLTNNGTIIANQTNPFLFYGVNFDNTGTLTVASGSTMSFQDSPTTFMNLVNGTLSGGTYQVTGTLQIPGDISTNAATITLTGTSARIIDQSSQNALAGFTSNSGALNLSPSLLSVTGGFTQSGTLGVTIGGTAAGTQYGKLTAAGAMSVGGTLNITLTTGYVPPIGTDFVILTGASVTGQFRTVNGTKINSTELFRVEYSATAVTLAVESSSGPPFADSPTLTTDFFGDGKGDVGIWRPSNGTWYILSNDGGENLTQAWGLPGDVPVPGDYYGVGKDAFAVWRPSNGIWYILANNGGPNTTVVFGLPDDVPVPADYDGDGKTDIALWRPSNGTFYVILSSTGQTVTKQWGLPGD
ncbi:MAG TPA: hypothetical protein VG860_03620, partial [Terriglobia bacterium]|nr:hypothetical protein [Terriglobia bacterium]